MPFYSFKDKIVSFNEINNVIPSFINIKAYNGDTTKPLPRGLRRQILRFTDYVSLFIKYFS